MLLNNFRLWRSGERKKESDFIFCPVCGHDNFDFERELNGYPLVICKFCSMVFCNIRPSEESIVKAYQELKGTNYDQFFGTEEVDVEHFHQNPSDGQLSNYRRLLSWVKRYKTSGKLLDIGCSNGAFLEYAQAEGYRTYGVEVRDVPNDIGAKLGIFHGVLKDAAFPENSFQVISAQALIEHLVDPSEFLEEVKRILLPGGILLLSGVPNYNSLWIKLGRDRFIGNRPMTHLNYFSPLTLRKLLISQDLCIIDQKCWGVSETVLYKMGWKNAHAKKKNSGKLLVNIAGKVFYNPVNTILNWTGLGSVIDILAVKS